MDQSVEVEPRQLQLNVEHYEQKFDWDCGLSCILMVLNVQKEVLSLINFYAICNEEGFNKTTWTIDLCYLLKRYNINHVYYTLILGTFPGYKDEAFYKDVLPKDEERVNNRFKTANENGIKVIEGSLTLSHILNHLKNGPVIILTNASLLCCDICKENKLMLEFRKCIPRRVPYQGHYVVLCGYDCCLGKVYYRNPSYKDRICVMSMNRFEEARRSYGTDEDAILIFNHTN